MLFWEWVYFLIFVIYRDNRNKALRESLDNIREEVGGGDRWVFNNFVEIKGRSMGKEYIVGMSDKFVFGSL